MSIKKNKNTKKKGLSLIEAIVAISIFSLLMITASAVMINIIVNYTEIRAIQKDLENAQFAIGIMSKTLRTSSIIINSESPDTDRVDVFDFSQGKCISYRFQASKLQTASYAGADPTECTAAFGGYKPMTTGNVSGRFDAIATDLNATPPIAGKVVISIDIKAASALDKPGVDYDHIQSTVSLRDF